MNVQVSTKAPASLRACFVVLLLAALGAAPSVAQPQVALSPGTITLGAGGTAAMTACIDTVQATDTLAQITQAGPAGVIAFTYDDPTTLPNPDFNLAAGATVRVPAGELCVAFTVNAVAAGGPVLVVATLPPELGGGSDTSQVSVAALGIVLTPADLAMQSGANAHLTITISAAAPFGGVPVIVFQAGPTGIIDFTWTDPNPPNTLHSHVTTFAVTMPAGTSSFVFQVNALAVGGPVFVTATLAAGGSATAEVTVGNNAFSGQTWPQTGPSWIDVVPGAVNPHDTSFIGTDGLQLPPETLFPHGALRLHVVSCPRGGIVSITWGFPTSPTLAGAQLWKLSRLAAAASVPGAVITPGRVRYGIQDGGPFDADGLVNGEVVDPVAVGALTYGIPALTRWGLAALLLLMALVGATLARLGR